MTINIQIRLMVRRILHHVARVILFAISRRYYPSVNPATVALIVAPHPDDAELGCGGLIAVRSASGAIVHVVYLTDGSGSHPQHPTITPQNLARQRANEARAAFVRLGGVATNLTFLGASDGSLQNLSPIEGERIIAAILQQLDGLRPDEVFLPWRYDGSTEHVAGFELFRSALARSEATPRLYEFPVWAQWNPLLLLKLRESRQRVWRHRFPEHRTDKCAAIALYRSQVEPTPPWKESVLSATFVSFFQHSEEFYFEA